jgi:ketosteroid isomerase-like protein
MAQDSNVDLARWMLEALSGRDAPATESVLDDSSLFHVPGKSGMAGQYQGEEAILGLLRRMAQLTNGTLRYTLSSVLTTHDRVIVLRGRATSTHQGRRLDTETVHVASLEDSRIREMWVFHDDQAHFDEYWTSNR